MSKSAVSEGVDALFGGVDNPNEFPLVVNLDDIEIAKQVRDEFEDDDSSLADLGRSLRVCQLEEIGLRLNPPESEKPYLLFFGERRVRGARLEGLQTLRARVFDLTAEQARLMQFAENVHRKNLTMLEEAAQLQADLDQLGTAEAVAELHKKSTTWVSKRLGLLKLGPQAKRLVAENISADVELIGDVRAIEKLAPEKAAALVDDLKKTRGKKDARAIVEKVKDVVKPSKKKAEAQSKQQAFDAKAMQQGATGTTATAKDKRHEAPGDVVTSFNPEQLLSKAYAGIFEFGAKPRAVVDGWVFDELEAVEDHLNAFYEAGKQEKNISRGVILGFRKNVFAGDGAGAFALVAFLHGADSGVKFDLLNIVASVKE